MIEAGRPAFWPSQRCVSVLVAVAALAALAALVPALAYAAAALGAIVLALLAADAALGPSPRTLRVARAPLGPLALRRAASVFYEVDNRADFAIRCAILEVPPATLEFTKDAVEATLQARSRATLELRFSPRERGPARFGALYVWAENPIGLLRRRYRVAGNQEARVLPDLSAVTNYGVLARRSTLLQLGLRRLRLRGTGSEFESLREYAAGDAFRLIDWKATARRGRMMVAQYEVERSQNVIVALDCGRLMTPGVGRMRKFDYALTAALSIARVAEAAGDNTGLLAFASKPLLEFAPRRGKAHCAALARAAYDLQPRFEEPDYETLLAGLCERYSKRSLVVVLTDVLDQSTSAALLAGLQSLVPRHLALCVLMNDAAIENALATPPQTVTESYRTSVAMTLADEREKSVALLRSRGILVIDVPAPRLTVALMDAYLHVKARGLL